MKVNFDCKIIPFLARNLRRWVICFNGFLFVLIGIGLSLQVHAMDNQAGALGLARPGAVSVINRKNVNIIYGMGKDLIKQVLKVERNRAWQTLIDSSGLRWRNFRDNLYDMPCHSLALCGNPGTRTQVTHLFQDAGTYLNYHVFKNQVIPLNFLSQFSPQDLERFEAVLNPIVDRYQALAPTIDWTQDTQGGWSSLRMGSVMLSPSAVRDRFREDVLQALVELSGNFEIIGEAETGSFRNVLPSTSIVWGDWTDGDLATTPDHMWVSQGRFLLDTMPGRQVELVYSSRGGRNPGAYAGDILSRSQVTHIRVSQLTAFQNQYMDTFRRLSNNFESSSLRLSRLGTRPPGVPPGPYRTP